MRIAPPITMTVLLVLTCSGLIVIFSGSAVAQTTERADKRFFGWTEDAKQHGSVSAQVSGVNPYSEIREMERAGEQIGQGVKALIRSWLAVSGVLARPHT